MVLLLGLRLLANLIISGFVCLPGHELNLAGKIQVTYQNDPKYISSIGPVMWLEEVTHRQVEGEKLRVSGICEERVIARLLGQIWLKDSAFFVSKQTPDRVRGDGSWSFQADGFSVKLREIIEESWNRNMPPIEAGLVAGIVLGDKEAVGGELYRQMKDTGLVHIAVASGYNISAVIDTLVSVLIVFLSRRLTLVVAVVFAVMYAFLVGFEAPVVRAVLMAMLAIGAKMSGRRVKGIWIWWVVVWLMLMIDPGQLTAISFQLTVAATFGLLVIEPAIRRLASHLGGGHTATVPGGKLRTATPEEERFSSWKVAGGLLPGGNVSDQEGKLERWGSILGFWQTAAAQIAVMPILWWHFGQFKLIGLVTNVIVMVVPWIMFGGVLSLMLGWIPVVGQLVSWWTWVWAHLLVMWVGWWNR